MFHCPVGVWVIEQHAIILSATVRSPTVLLKCHILLLFLHRKLTQSWYSPENDNPGILISCIKKDFDNMETYIDVSKINQAWQGLPYSI